MMTRFGVLRIVFVWVLVGCLFCGCEDDNSSDDTGVPEAAPADSVTPPAVAEPPHPVGPFWGQYKGDWKGSGKSAQGVKAPFEFTAYFDGTISYSVFFPANSGGGFAWAVGPRGNWTETTMTCDYENMHLEITFTSVNTANFKLTSPVNWSPYKGTITRK